METPFDKSLQLDSLLWIKLCIPYLPPDTQRMMAIYVRFTELQYAFSSFHAFHRISHDPMDMFQEMRPFMSPDTCEMLDNLMNMMSMMDMMKELQNEDAEEGFDPMSMMTGMLSPDQQELFDMFHTMNAGGDTDVRLDE